MKNNTLSIANQILNQISNINYGFPDKNGQNIMLLTPSYWESSFFDFYYLQSPQQLLNSKIGVCFDLVELERFLFERKNIKLNTYFVFANNNKELPSHTFACFKHENNWFWFEYSWYDFRGIHKYKSLKDLLCDVGQKFKTFNNISKEKITKIFKYTSPPEGISCMGFYDFCQTFKTIKIL